MRISKLVTTLGTVAVLGLTSVVSITGPAAAETVIHRGNGAEPESLDPHKLTGVPEANILYDLSEGLLALSASAEPAPGVAERWDISDDGTTYTFHLRQNAKWSNGDPVTAEDFVYSLRRAVDPATASDYAPILTVIKNADPIIAGEEKDLTKLGVEAVDPQTLKITLNASTPYFLGLLTHSISYPVHKATVEKFGDQWTRPGNSVTNGAYIMQEWVPQSRIVVAKNPNYWDAANVKIDKVIWYPTEDVAEELKRFRAGELDVTASMPSDQIKFAKANLKKNLHITPYLGTYYYVINLTKEPLGKDVKLRQALAMALNREVLVEKITQAGELPAYSWVPPGIPGYEPAQLPFGKMDQKQRNAEAKKLFEEAGYGPNNPLKLELLYNTNENHRKIAIAVANMWKQALGAVDVALTNQEWKVYLDTRDKKAFEIARAAWIGDYADASNFLDLFLSSAGERNDAGYNNPKFDDLMAQAAKEANAEKRQQLLHQAEEVFLADLPLIPIYHYTNKYLVSDRVDGWVENVLGYNLSRYLSIKG
jgi:oligopeptide transport system substrate-binding protein